MENSQEYLGILITFVLAAGIAGILLVLNAFLGPKNKKSLEKGRPFECGVDRLSRPAGHFSVKFYLIAMLFILFDVEIVWFFPWAVLVKEMKWAGLIEMLAFAAVMILGFIYTWKKGALEWEK